MNQKLVHEEVSIKRQNAMHIEKLWKIAWHLKQHGNCYKNEGISDTSSSTSSLSQQSKLRKIKVKKRHREQINID